MKIHLANYQNKIGGGWSQARYLYEAIAGASYEESDVYLIAGATMVTYDQFDQAKKDGKKIVLRVDNHLLPSRNRNTGMSRLKYFAENADLLIYQSQWAKEYLSPIISKDGVVILNGVDTNIFKPSKKVNEVLYVRSSRINEKGWEMARYYYSRHQELGKLNIVGKFSAENLEYRFDFINNEDYLFWGEQPRNVVAEIMGRSKYFLYSYFMDACSNTLLEAKASGCEIIDVYGMLKTGGAAEIMACEDISLTRMLKEYEGAISAIIGNN